MFLERTDSVKDAWLLGYKKTPNFLIFANAMITYKLTGIVYALEFAYNPHGHTIISNANMGKVSDVL